MKVKSESEVAQLCPTLSDPIRQFKWRKSLILMTDVTDINDRHFIIFAVFKTHSVCKRTLKLLKMDKEYEWKIHRDFLCGTVGKNPPVSAGDIGLISGPGRLHMLWSS